MLVLKQKCVSNIIYVNKRNNPVKRNFGEFLEGLKNYNLVLSSCRTIAFEW